MEPQRRALWDERVAEAGKWHLAFAQLANWPQTLVTPIQRMMVLGTMMLGAYLAMNDPSGYMVGGLFAFMMLSGRVAQPLVGLARLVEDYEEVGARSARPDPCSTVRSRPTPARSACAANWSAPSASGRHLHLYRHQDAGARPGQLLDSRRHHAGIGRPQRLRQVHRSPACCRASTAIIGGYLKIDGADLREINLRHLR